MTPLEATVELMRTWATLGMMKGRTPDELRGDALALLTGIQGTLTPPKRERKPKPKGPVHIDMKGLDKPKEADPWS